MGVEFQNILIMINKVLYSFNNVFNFSKNLLLKALSLGILAKDAIAW